jgi:serine/threonine protein phosphatase 1
MIYAVSDLHGCYDAWLRALDAVSLSDGDTLYVLGDVVDRGPEPIRLLRDMMERPNVIPLLGNHEYMMASVLGRLAVEITAENAGSHLTAEDLMAHANWMRNGGGVTLEAFRRLSRGEQADILDYLGEFSLYEEVSAGGRDFVLVHAGFESFVPGKPLWEYGVEHTLFTVPAPGADYFPSRWLVTGHRPTPDGRIRRDGRHLSIDCGCVFGGALAVLRLDDLREFYVPGSPPADIGGQI